MIQERSSYYFKTLSKYSSHPLKETRLLKLEKNIFGVWGLKERLVPDNAKSFTSKKMKAFTFFVFFLQHTLKNEAINGVLINALVNQ